MKDFIERDLLHKRLERNWHAHKKAEKAIEAKARRLAKKINVDISKDHHGIDIWDGDDTGLIEPSIEEWTDALTILECLEKIKKIAGYIEEAA